MIVFDSLYLSYVQEFTLKRSLVWSYLYAIVKRHMHPKTVQLLETLEAWCDQAYGRRSQAARELGVAPSLFTDWLKRRRTPNADQAFAIEDFLKWKRSDRK